MAPSISLCMIVRNVEKSIKDCLQSIVPHVDEIIITDTGSTDNTRQIIAQVAPNAIIVEFTPETNPEAFAPDTQEHWGPLGIPGPFSGKMMLCDFGAARQSGWCKATKDYVMWIDSDDVVENAQNIKDILLDLQASNIHMALLNYDYASDANGKVNCKLTRERIALRTSGTGWNQPIHETLGPYGAARLYPTVNIKHRRYELGLQPEVAHRNLKVLTKWWNANKDNGKPDPRTLFYLATEQRWLWPDRAIQNFTYYTKISGWDEERALALSHCGKIYEDRHQYDKAIQQYALAIVDTPWNCAPYFCAARIAYFKRDWAQCIQMTQRGFEARDRKEGRRNTLMFDPADHYYRPHVYYVVALIEMGDLQTALKSCQEGLKWNPQDPHLKGNKELIERVLGGQNPVQARAQTLAENGMVEASSPVSNQIKFRHDDPLDAPIANIPDDFLIAFALQLWKRSHHQGLYARALQFIDSLPESVAYDTKVRQAREMTISKLQVIGVGQQRVSHKIVIWCGPGWEEWSPNSIATTGIGGSETAAVCMARELTTLGHKVTVLSHCGSLAGNYDGVQYVHFQQGIDRPHDFACDVFVVSRQPFALQIKIPRKLTYVWVHDIHVGEPSEDIKQILQNVDKFFVLTQWHRGFFLQTYPFLDPKKVVLTANGIDTKLYLDEPVKEGNRLIYASSPDRGLQRLLEIFPSIRQQVPDAELHVFYGFHNWKMMAKAANNQEQLNHIAMFEGLLEAQKDAGVTYHGRIPEPQLAKEFAKSKVWAYPTWFTETFCITAVMAQASGCIPVTTEIGALPETVSHGFILKPPCTSNDYAERFVKRVVSILRNEKLDGDERAPGEYASAGRQYALSHHDWKNVAQQWSDDFSKSLVGKE